MARFKKIIRNKKEGKITYNKGIVDNIVFLAVSEIEKVELSVAAQQNKMKSSAVKVTFEKGCVHIDVTVKIHYTERISEMAFKIQEAIRHNVEAMTEYSVGSVDVFVNGIMFDEPIETTTEVTSENK